MNHPDLIRAILPVIKAFNKQKTPYYIGGSIASSVYGLARATLDADIIADIKSGDISFLKKSLENEYYIEESMIEDAIARSSSFNIIHLETMIKIDVFIHKDQLYQKKVFQRKRKDTLDDSIDAVEFYFATAEDIILNKLQWYEMGNEASERQWLDVLGVIKVQEQKLDREYLRKWGNSLGLLDLLNKAFDESGFVL